MPVFVYNYKKYKKMKFECQEYVVAYYLILAQIILKI